MNAQVLEKEKELDLTKLKYVLYARKSTDDPERQARSIPDQIKECLDLADRLHLNIINRNKPLKEKKSAKEPHKREIFNQMLRDIKAGKYDAILAWNPDRLARNMLEAGLIIDMADSKIIKDFRFVTHIYSSDANGKMLLGMAFVLSKQYSDKLSQDVSRGIGNRMEEGKTQIPKYGYTNEEGIYRPDGKNFELIVEAWQKRAQNEKIEDITDYLVKSGFYRLIKSSGEKQKMTQQKLSHMFQDSFYYGVLVQSTQTVRLTDIYDFVPAVSEEDYFKVQSLDYRKIRASKPHKNNYYPFRMIIYCHYCGMSMRVAPSTGGSKKRYLYARCDNKKCIRNSEENLALPKDKRIRAGVRTKYLLAFVREFLKDGLNLTEADYNDYYDSLKIISDQKRQELRNTLNNQRGVLKQYNQELTDRSLGITKLKKDSTAWKINDNEINRLSSFITDLELSIKRIEEQIKTPEQDQLSIEQFLNLSKNAVNIIDLGNVEVKDKICRLIFTNFFMDDEKVTNYRLNEPFATLLNKPKILPSRSTQN